MGEVAGLGQPARGGFARRLADPGLPRSAEGEAHQSHPRHARGDARRRYRGTGGGSRAGAVAMARAMEEAISRAREVHFGWCAARNITHAGAIGYFALQAANAGMAGIVMSASGPMMAYHGARVAGVSSNPLAIAFPGREQAAAPARHVHLERRDGQGHGCPRRRARDPAGLGNGRARDATPPIPRKVRPCCPWAGRKGPGLSFMIECLCSLTVGNPIIAPALAAGGALDAPFLNGVAMAVDLAAFGDRRAHSRRSGSAGRSDPGAPAR